MSQRVVIDSSMSLKWWMDDEEFIEEARDLLKKVVAGEIEQVVPELWFYEVANGINTAVKRERISNETALNFIEELQAMTPTLIPIAQFLPKIFKESIKYGYATYDIAYMVIAENEGIPFITADKKFFERVKDDKAFVKHCRI